jgi:hypothetical protein
LDFYEKGGRMLINGKNSILQKLIFEVRYEYGYAYLDKCGRIVNTITRAFPEWNVSAINLDGATLVRQHRKIK